MLRVKLQPHEGGPAVTSQATISPLEATDRLAIRELIDAYAHCADCHYAAMAPTDPAAKRNKLDDETVLGDGSHATRLWCCTVCRDGVIGEGG
jgi:hypothetical protein